MLEKGALTGIKVIDLSRLLPGPYCSMILADHGARVIAVEDGKYKQENLYVPDVNRNKEHIDLNLKTPEGMEVFHNLLKGADVLIEGFRPGVTKRLGIDYESLEEKYPGLVYCSITGYGQTGPFRNVAGHDVNYLSFSGILDQIGPKKGPPTIPGVQFADMAGAVNGALGVALALFAREKTGRGQHIDISLTDAMVAFLPVSMLMSQILGAPPARSDGMLSHRYACYNVYETLDGRYISIGAVEPRFWAELCEHLGVPEYSELQYDENRREEIIEFMKKEFKKKTIAKWEVEFSKLDICWGRVQNVTEALHDPMFRQRGMVVDIDGKKKDERITLLGLPVKLEGTPGQIRTPPVGFGENTTEILLELGYSKEEIEAFRDKKVIL